MKKNVDKFHLF